MLSRKILFFQPGCIIVCPVFVQRARGGSGGVIEVLCSCLPSQKLPLPPNFSAHDLFLGDVLIVHSHHFVRSCISEVLSEELHEMDSLRKHDVLSKCCRVCTEKSVSDSLLLEIDER